MQRTKHQMPGFCRRQRKSYGFEITQFAHQHHVGVLAQRGAQGGIAHRRDLLDAAKIEANGVKSYTLEIVEPDQVGDKKEVGSCDGGTKRIVYTKQE